MIGVRLSEESLRKTVPGEALTLAAVLAIMAIAVVAVVCYKMFTSESGTTKLPGGWQFTWK